MKNSAFIPSYRIITRRTILRCWEPQDAPLVSAAIEANLDHLRPWMDWAREEPKNLKWWIAWLRRCRGNFDLDKDYTYAILNKEETRILGGTGLHTRLGRVTANSRSSCVARDGIRDFSRAR